MLKEVADLVTEIKAAWSQVPPVSHRVGERVLVLERLCQEYNHARGGGE
jgi:hypothetical protein